PQDCDLAPTLRNKFRAPCSEPQPSCPTLFNQTLSPVLPRHWPVSLLPNLVRDQLLKNVTRIVLKLGTGVLTNARKQLDSLQMEHLVGQIAAQRKAGRELVVVTSGAVGAGMGALGW